MHSPMSPGANSPKGNDVHRGQYIRQIPYIDRVIERLDSAFTNYGDVESLREQVEFVSNIFSIVRENEAVIAQVEKGSKEEVLKGDLPNAIQQALSRLWLSHQNMVTMVLRFEDRLKPALIDAVYELLKNRCDIDLCDYFDTFAPYHLGDGTSMLIP